MRLLRHVSLVGLFGTAASVRTLTGLPHTSAAAATAYGGARRAVLQQRAQLHHVRMASDVAARLADELAEAKKAAEAASSKASQAKGDAEAKRELARAARASVGGATAAAPAAPVAAPRGGYDHTSIERKWQDYWDEHDTFATQRREGKEKKYVLDMFPYPSGAGLHVGHPEGYTASDIMARYWRMCDFDVLHPMGWDSFGLPAEQHAINTGTRPEETTKTNIANFKRQLRSLGFSYDWKREIATTDIGYVKWTQWIFLQLFKKDLAFQAESRVNWCAELGTVLANEEVIDGKSERGDFPVTRMPLRQWVLRITEYAEQLAADLATEGIQWPEGTMSMQKTWIGRSEGAEITFAVEGAPDGAAQQIDVFTTRPDTLMGATYAVIAPEHPLAEAQLAGDKAADDETTAALRSYVAAAASTSDLDRTTAKVKTGVYSGLQVTHPLTGASLPLWVADYVLAGYGTGAVMAVPAHDERDFDFAKAYKLPIVQVVAASADAAALDFEAEDAAAFVDHGVCVGSGEGFDGLKTAKAKKAVIAKLAEEGKGLAKISFKLRDWVFSRQRYWGEPIPIYFPVKVEAEGGDPRNGDAHVIDFDTPIAVDEADLPVKLPDIDDFKPGKDPQGVLAKAELANWRYFQKDGQWYARETNTMPQWAGSCWYYLRFADPDNSDAFVSAEAEKAWMPVDLYVGGAEHAVLHLLYARFWHKVLYDLDLVSTKEPFAKLVHQGMILGEDGEKMSKSRGNVVNPDDIVDKYGGDAMRLYEMFMGPLEAVKPWQTEQISGVVRFQSKVFALTSKRVAAGAGADEAPMAEETARLMHQTVRKVTQDVESMSFNTAISQMMVFTNHLQSLSEPPPTEAMTKLTLCLAPFAPHLAEELWQMLGHGESISAATWPTYDEAMCEVTTVTMGVQVGGKVKSEITLEKTADADEAKAVALADEKVQKAIGGKEIKKFVYVPGRIVNFVVGK